VARYAEFSREGFVDREDATIGPPQQRELHTALPGQNLSVVFAAPVIDHAQRDDDQRWTAAVTINRLLASRDSISLKWAERLENLSDQLLRRTLQQGRCARCDLLDTAP
jgi:hypothetical protein